jgi:hypothetical protein
MKTSRKGFRRRREADHDGVAAFLAARSIEGTPEAARQCAGRHDRWDDGKRHSSLDESTSGMSTGARRAGGLSYSRIVATIALRRADLFDDPSLCMSLTGPAASARTRPSRD